MPKNCIMVAVLSLIGSLLTAQTPGGPALGKWAFTGKDNAGLAWKGTLNVLKLDPARFNKDKYYALCDLDMESTDADLGKRGAKAPCAWDSGTRTLSFSTGVTSLYSFSAVLSADGKTLTGTQWTESKQDLRNAGKSAPVVTRTGQWSAKWTSD